MNIQVADTDCTPPVIIGKRCVEFCDGDRCYWVYLAPGKPVPETWEQAQAVDGAVNTDARCPSNWTIVASFQRNTVRCVRLTADRGTCYVPIRYGAPVPTTLAELGDVAAARGEWSPVGIVVGHIDVSGAADGKKTD